jgi:hypothetical protein
MAEVAPSVDVKTGDKIDFIDTAWLDICIATVVEITEEKVRCTCGNQSVEFPKGCLRTKGDRIQAMNHVLSSYHFDF